MTDIKQCGGVWLPIHERHMDAWMAERMRKHPEEMVGGRATYQYHKQLASMKWVKNFRVAVDIGAHCGLWSMNLVNRFSKVEAFEPIGLHRKCFGLNVQGNYTLHPYALGREAGRVAMHTTKGSSGDSWVDLSAPARVADVELRTLDSFGFLDVDFIKLDCEGYELFALQGGEETIKRCRPCICVEQKPGRAQAFGLPEQGAVVYLQSLGAVLRKEIGGDFIMSWDPDAEVKDGPEMMGLSSMADLGVAA